MRKGPLTNREVKAMANAVLDETLMGSAACPAFRISSTATDNNGGRFFEARTEDNRRIGYVDTAVTGGRLRVTQTKVLEAYRRCGTGTKLYAAAAAHGCEIKKPLTSDEARSGYAHSFWQKQVKKGRAFCAKEDHADRGRPEKFDDIFLSRDNCKFFEMRCPSGDLSGRSRRNRRKPRNR